MNFFTSGRAARVNARMFRAQAEHILSPASRNLLTRALPTCLVGMAVTTPIVAILQGSLLLLEYRAEHGGAPHPEVPCSGVVVVGSSSTAQVVATAAASATRPLRLLVVGDSLAAGVGVSGRSTPVLPESIARALSHSMSGRAVHWTCVGTPGMSSRQIETEIREMQDLSGGRTGSNPLIQRLRLWQAERRAEAERRLEQARAEAKRRLEHARGEAERRLEQGREWWEHHSLAQQRQLEEEERQAERKSTPGVVRWFKRTSARIQSEARYFREMARAEAERRLERARAEAKKRLERRKHAEQGLREEDNDRAVEPHQRGAIPRKAAPQRQKSSLLVRRQSLLDPAVVGHYDVAVVLTGLNDLKHMFLPFLMPGDDSQQVMIQAVADAVSAADEVREPSAAGRRNDRDDTDSRRELSKKTTPGLMNGLIQVLDALKSKMKIISTGEESPAHGKDKKDQRVPAARRIGSSDGDPSVVVKSKDSSDGVVVRTEDADDASFPLVVFPALPVAPTRLSQVAPLRWFLVPIIRDMDNKKRSLAGMFPDYVVYVEPPSEQMWEDAEEGRGEIWEAARKERVLWRGTDVAQNVVDRVEKLMKEHYQDLEDHDRSLYEIHADDVVELNDRDRGRSKYPGASFVSLDGIHPNDAGYDLFGRVIAQAILTKILEKKKKEESTTTGKEKN